MNKQTFFILVLVLAIVFVCIGCGSETPKEKSAESTVQDVESQADKTKSSTESIVDDNFGSTAGPDAEAGNFQNNAESESAAVVSGTGTYEQITQEKAKELMDAEEPVVILDVRTYEKYNESHIDGALCIPVEKLNGQGKTMIEQLIQKKDQIILVYCRSGNRSKTASQILANMGYTNVKEFGGINDWQYGTVTE